MKSLMKRRRESAGYSRAGREGGGVSLVRKALKEAFEGFCNNGNVAGSTSVELMAKVCDNILKKV
jgi:hypothetical protein